MQTKKTILGIDPGTLLMGYAVVSQVGSAISFINMDVLNLKKITSPSEKLAAIHSKINSLIEEYQPDELSIESPFYGKNPQALIKLGRAQGVAIAVALSKGVPVFEYAPLKIKQSITGRGQATKEQVWAMLCRILNLKAEMQPKYMDASDALGAAVCHCLQFKLPASAATVANITSATVPVGAKTPKSISTTSASAKKTSWEQFIKQNNNRIIK